MREELNNPISWPQEREAASSTSIRILVVDGHTLFRQGVAAEIMSQDDMVLLAEAANAAEALQQFRKHKPDIVLLDVRLSDTSGIDLMRTIRTEYPQSRFIVMTTFMADFEIKRSLEAGARACLPKTASGLELLRAVREVHAGKRRIPPEIAALLAEHFSDESLTGREVDVLQQIGSGRRNCDIAEKLFISELTVKVHVKHLMEKLGASDRTQAFAIGLRRGIIQL